MLNLKQFSIVIALSCSMLSAEKIKYNKPVSKEILKLFKEIIKEEEKITSKIIKINTIVKSEKNHLLKMEIEKYRKTKKKWKIENSDFKYKMEEYKGVVYLEEVLEKMKEIHTQKEKDYNKTIEEIKDIIKCYQAPYETCNNKRLISLIEEKGFLKDLKENVEMNIENIKSKYFSQYSILEKDTVHNLVEVKTQIINQLEIIN